MKFNKLVLVLFAVYLTACNFSLAEDVTPPPNYVPPTPMPTLGPLYPIEAPNIENGAAIYAEKCVECHGPAGMGDGEQGKQLPVTVAALGLPQVGQVASPSDWYMMVSRGNIERFMPPFSSLTDQERWDVVAYALTLHADEKSLARGKELFDTFCADCPVELFRNQEWMASLSNIELTQILKDGNADIPALGDKLTEGGFVELAFYIRTLSFAAPTPTPEPPTPTPTVAATEATPSSSGTKTTPPAAETGTPFAETTPLATDTSVPFSPEANGGKVAGSVSGKNVLGLNVTLRGFDHASDASGPQEVVTLEAVTDANGNYVFEGLELPEGRIFYAEAIYEGVTYNSDFATVAAGDSELNIPSFKVYPTSTDFSTLVFDQVHFFVSISEGTVQVIGVYTFSNTSEQTVLVESATEVPFIKFPADVGSNYGYDVTDDSAPLIAAETGFAMPPSERPYSILAFYNLPYDGNATIEQPFALSASSVLMLIPDGVKAKSNQLTEGEIQNFQGSNYREFRGGAMKSGDTLTFDLSGNPKTTGGEVNTQRNILIGVGVLGAMLILAGVWMYLRDRNRVVDESDEEKDEAEFDSEEEILDAIIALDDLHRAGKIPDEAYRTRREELKARLKA